MPANHFSLEFQLLITCSWVPPTAERIDAEGVNWDAFLALVRRHQVPVLAQRALRGLAPYDAGAELKRMAQFSGARALVVGAELLKLCRAFESANIEMIPLKGVLLSLHLFGDAGTRHPGDLDVMIRPQDLEATNELLKRLGYVSGVPAAALPLLRGHDYECSYEHPDNGFSVDVHWGHELWTAGQTSELWEQCEIVQWGGVPVRQLRGDALLLYLCDHGAKHRWSRVKWLSDVAMLFAAPRALPASELYALARRWDLEQPLAEAASLVHRLYGIELAPGMPTDHKAANESLAAMLMTRQELLAAHKQWGLRKLRRRKALPWYAHVRRLLIQAEDLQLCPLPGAFAWLYYPLRPFLWCWRRSFPTG